MGPEVLLLEAIRATDRSIAVLARIEQVRGTKIRSENGKDFENEVLSVVFRDGHWQGETLFRNLKTGASIPVWQHIKKETIVALPWLRSAS